MVHLGPLSEQWRNVLEDEFRQPYLSELSAFLRAERAAGKEIFPAAAGKISLPAALSARKKALNSDR